MGLSGCDSSTFKVGTNANGTPSGTYVYTVTATSGTLTHTQAVNVVVQ